MRKITLAEWLSLIVAVLVGISTFFVPEIRGLLHLDKSATTMYTSAWLKWLGGLILVSIGTWLLSKYFSKPRQSNNLSTPTQADKQTTSTQADKPTTPTRPADFRPIPTPQDIYGSISSARSARPFDEEELIKNYLGLPVRWRARLALISTVKGSLDIRKVHSSTNGHSIFCEVSITEYRRLKIAKAEDLLELTGFIESISMGGFIITLNPVEITFLDKEEQKEIPTRIEILSHSNGNKVGWQGEFSGSVEPPDTTVQVFVTRARANRFWKQWAPEMTNTHWKTKCQFGYKPKEDNLGEYDVIAIAGGQKLDGGKALREPS